MIFKFPRGVLHSGAEEEGALKISPGVLVFFSGKLENTVHAMFRVFFKPIFPHNISAIFIFPVSRAVKFYLSLF